MVAFATIPVTAFEGKEVRATGILDGKLALKGFLTNFETREVAGIAVAVALRSGLLTTFFCTDQLSIFINSR